MGENNREHQDRLERSTQQIVGGLDSTAKAALWIPERIGAYHVRSVIASGGMGTVYLAVQEHPRRLVAVKVIKQGIAARSALKRFEYEAQILGRLRHPNIAQIYEAGTHDAGEGDVPFFAMEYIPNAKPITDYAQSKAMSMAERLRLFTKVCEAVHHGHLKGIIHRDLKPSNILVDSTGQPRIIDFGVARAIDSDLAVTTLQTEIGQLIGTLQYMSPEQCAADPNDLDVRSDIYALGVVLYALLTDHLPYDLTGRPVFEAARAIREEIPARPSSFDAALRGDVETIILKTLEKDRDRRYRSADELRRDIESYLEGDAISARPPSMVYQLRVFARRNRMLVTALGAVFLALLIGTIATSAAMVRAQRGMKLATEAETRAALEAERARAISTFLQRSLASVNPFLPGRSSREALLGSDGNAYAGQVGQAITVLDMLHQFTRSLDTAFPRSPQIEAELRHTLGETLLRLGQFRESQSQLERAIALRRAELGPDHPDVARAMVLLAESLDWQGRGPDADRTYALAVEALGRSLGEAEQETLEAASQRASALLNRGNVEEAITLERQALDTAIRVRGEDDPATLAQMVRCCESLWVVSKVDAALELGRRAVAGFRRAAGTDAQATADAMFALSGPLRSAGLFREAEEMASEALRLTRANLGEENPLTLDYMRNLANIYTVSERYGDAVPLFQSALTSQRRLLPPTHIELLLTLNDFACCRALQGTDLIEAETLAREACSGFETVFGSDTQYALNAADTLAMILRSQGRLEEAIEVHERVLNAAERGALPTTLRIDSHTGLAGCHAKLSHLKLAEAHYLAAAELIEAQGSTENTRAVTIADGLIALYEAEGKTELAAAWQEKRAGFTGTSK